jgi:uncharacterized protein YdiU (UPF0061 family)
LADPYLVGLSASAARLLQWDSAWLSSEEGLHFLIGNRLPEAATSIATVYSGHQFGVWAGQLGDGRALLLGESNGQEVQLKGAGLTPYSRMGDGRAVLRSSIREFLCSEAMAALQIPTTRALSVVGSNQPIYREEVETAAVVVRLAPSFIRFGHFEHFCHHGLHGELKTLADYVIDRYYTECREALPETPALTSPYARLLHQVADRTARMVALWQSVGFCHGVMNTDNMGILGLTLDYGPFQFLDAYVPGHRCNHSDTHGRYAFNRQPAVAFWNLACLAQALTPLVEDQEQLVLALDRYKASFPLHYASVMAAKLGLREPLPEDSALHEAIFGLLAREGVDHTIFWRRLSHWVAHCDERDERDTSVRDLFVDRSAIDAWLQSYVQRLSRQSSQYALSCSDVSSTMLRTNPKFVLRNHLAELAIRAAREGDFSVTQQMLHVLQFPFDEHPAHAAWADFPPDWAQSISISCSS